MKASYSLRSHQSRRRIRRLDELFDTYPVDTESILEPDKYLEPIAPYKLVTSEAKCQYLRGSKQCGQHHMKGVVLRTTENKYVLIGNCCAFSKLGIVHEQVGAELKSFDRAVKLAERQERLEELIRNKDFRLLSIDTMRSELGAIISSVDKLRESLPASTVDRLNERAKSRTTQVIWEYRTIKEGEIDGERHEEIKWYPITIGELRGLAIWEDSQLTHFRKELAELRSNLRDLSLADEPSESEITQAEIRLSGLQNVTGHKQFVERYRKNLEQFFGIQNLLLLPHIMSDHKQRAACLDAVSRILNRPIDVSAQRDISEFDARLRNRCNSSHIRFKR